MDIAMYNSALLACWVSLSLFLYKTWIFFFYKRVFIELPLSVDKWSFWAFYTFILRFMFYRKSHQKAAKRMYKCGLGQCYKRVIKLDVKNNVLWNWWGGNWEVRSNEVINRPKFKIFLFELLIKKLHSNKLNVMHVWLSYMNETGKKLVK